VAQSNRPCAKRNTSERIRSKLIQIKVDPETESTPVSSTVLIIQLFLRFNCFVKQVDVNAGPCKLQLCLFLTKSGSLLLPDDNEQSCQPTFHHKLRNLKVERIFAL
jgi:hypothetical protein